MTVGVGSGSNAVTATMFQMTGHTPGSIGTKYVHENYPPAKNPLLYGAERTAKYLNIVRACTLARLEILGW